MGLTVAIASGKGGTGKTTVATCLAATTPRACALIDCDVEAPNAHLFCPGMSLSEEVACVTVPVFEPAACDGCGRCARACRFNALMALPHAPPMLFPELCHACGACLHACLRGAVSETPARIGVVRIGRWGEADFADGLLDIGQARSSPLIQTVARSHPGAAVRILDAPPGTGCPAVAALRAADYVVMVAEPTPFGLHDLRLAVQTARALALPFGVVINRCDMGDRMLWAFCAEQNVPILAELPHDRRVAEACSVGRLPVERVAGFRERFEALWQRLLEEAGG